jgi:hypothetical protein
VPQPQRYFGSRIMAWKRGCRNELISRKSVEAKGAL